VATNAESFAAAATQISANLNREGVVESFEVKGTMYLTIAQVSVPLPVFLDV
jgi:hypothetical protein